MASKRRINGPRYGVPDEENPEWTAEMFRDARPAEEVIPGITAAALRLRERLRGRPKLENPKAHVSLRLDPVVIAAFKEDGPGWQGRINETLLRAVRRRRSAAKLSKATPRRSKPAKPKAKTKKR
ncbi:MAG TPA: BrnA antitoxin family protein [Rhizomicrobium sp.]|nr:BrnA antitoxin family protein [Rhizomicrobium sp.]